MDLKQIIKVLEEHNNWRRGDVPTMMVDPKTLGKAIDKAIEKLKSEAGFIRWAYFEDQTPNYGDQILLQYPPESGRDPVVTIYDRHTDWIYGCRYAVITHCDEV